eukprot:TRINITY_DN2865_c0_g1_i1.p1 TRINITY_DN2865_c0_g1~~TRINITY_DN2865_c0_g1_i1.p1  ORF type:complete len:470 (+),score=123.85 TRINITY_DN2865_c0_g1_i1:40-1449(+)
MEEGSANRRYVYTDGRPPWYDNQGSIQKPYVIGICGGSASGKTSVCNKVMKELGIQWVALLSQDSFYRGLTPEESADAVNYNFDHPNAFDWELLTQTIDRLKQGKSVEVPVYDFSTHSRSATVKTIYGGDVIILEGILIFHSEKLRDHMDMKIFVDEDSDIRLARRIKRDVAERGRDVGGIINQYLRFVKPAFDDYIRPTMKYADLIIPRGVENRVAIEILVKSLKDKLLERGLNSQQNWETSTVLSIPPNVTVLQPSAQLNAMMTVLRDRSTERGDFVFYSDRINRLLFEQAFALLPSYPQIVTTPTLSEYSGIGLVPTEEVCAVSVMRGGACMENPLKEILQPVTFGQILIQSDSKKNPRLFYVHLPRGVHEKYVFLLEPTVATGATVKMAIQTLIDHGAQESKIVLVSVIASSHGLNSVSYSYPKIKIVTCAVDNALDDHGYIIPGVGNYGDRYLGTEKMVEGIQK